MEHLIDISTSTTVIPFNLFGMWNIRFPTKSSQMLPFICAALSNLLYQLKVILISATCSNF